MAARRRTPNPTLRALIEEARWTNHHLALAVNRIAAEAGVDLHYDRSTISHWLAGSRPRRPVPAFVAEALTRRLGRCVRAVDTGLVDTPGNDHAAIPARSGVFDLLDLVAADMDPQRSATLRTLPYRIEWTIAAAYRPEDPRPAHSSLPAPGVGPGLVEAVRVMTDVFAAADRAFGGGHARSALITYLATDVAVWLRARASGQNRRDLLRAAGTLVCLAGFMCFDDLYHHLAQRYYRVALRLFAEAGELTGHVVVLREMSAQAWFLGHHRQAARLAEAAVEQAGGRTPPGTRAALLGQAAVTHAALANRRTALSCLTEAERHLGRATVTDPTDLADHAYQTARALASLRDGAGAESALRTSLRHRAPTERRSRMITTDYLAEVQLRSGRLEQACDTWQRFLGEYPYVRSGRIRSACLTLRRRLLPHQKNPVVARTLRYATRLSSGSTC